MAIASKPCGANHLVRNVMKISRRAWASQATRITLRVPHKALCVPSCLSVSLSLCILLRSILLYVQPVCDLSSISRATERRCNEWCNDGIASTERVHECRCYRSRCCISLHVILITPARMSAMFYDGPRDARIIGQTDLAMADKNRAHDLISRGFKSCSDFARRGSLTLEFYRVWYANATCNDRNELTHIFLMLVCIILPYIYINISHNNFNNSTAIILWNLV